MRPFVSVLIPAYNEEALLPRALRSVQNSFKTAPVSYEIIVCNNNSTDKTASVAAELGAHVVFEAHNQISRARNRAAQEARGEWLLFLDADSELTPPLWHATLAAMNDVRVCGGGAHLRFDGDNRLEKFSSRFWNNISSGLRWAAGSYIFCRMNAFRAVRGFDERYYAAEELIFSQKLKRWARRNDKLVQIITAAPVLTSARKFKMYSPWRLFLFLVVSSFPGAWRSRRFCGLWYDR